MSQSQITWSHDTEKITEGSEIDNVIEHSNSILVL